MHAYFVALTLCACGLGSVAEAQAPDAGVATTPPATPPTATPPPATTPPTAPSGETSPAEGAAGDATATGTDAATDEPALRATTERTPKVAIVLVGDPDDAALAALDALTVAIAVTDTLRLPRDAALSVAMSGRGSDDGLDDVRRERRGLGLSERRDVPVLVRLGRLASASALIVVRASSTGFEAVMLDVGREAFFDGALSLPADGAAIVRFVERRARAAERARAADTGDGPAPETSAEAAVSASVAGAATEDDEAQPEGDPVLRWFEENWAYLAAGGLLAGGVVFAVVVATDSGPPPPMLRFTPGGL